MPPCPAVSAATRFCHQAGGETPAGSDMDRRGGRGRVGHRRRRHCRNNDEQFRADATRRVRDAGTCRITRNGSVPGLGECYRGDGVSGFRRGGRVGHRREHVHRRGTGTLTVSGTADNLFGGDRSEGAELFGGSGELADCDVQGLAAFLAENPEKAKAWADVRDVDPAQIGEYLKTLTPVVLLHDTLVTNYGFSGGVAVPFQAVLQAGTGVLVDWTGQPVVRCACGNPLSPPEPTNLSSAELLGTRWDDFDPARTVVVSGGPVAAGFVLVDVLTGQSYTRPVGSAAPAPTTAAHRRRRRLPHRRQRPQLPRGQSARSSSSVWDGSRVGRRGTAGRFADLCGNDCKMAAIRRMDRPPQRSGPGR